MLKSTAIWHIQMGQKVFTCMYSTHENIGFVRSFVRKTIRTSKKPFWRPKSHFNVQKPFYRPKIHSNVRKIIRTSEKKFSKSKDVLFEHPCLSNCFSHPKQMSECTENILMGTRIYWSRSIRQTIKYLPVDTESKISCFWVKKISFW